MNRDGRPGGRELFAGHLVQMAGQVEAAEHAGAHRVGDLLVRHGGLGVGPVGRLLGQDRHRRRHGDRRIPLEVLLVAGGLEVHPGQQGVVHAHRPGSAVLQDQCGMPVQDPVQPVQVGAVVGEQSGAGAVGVEVGAHARVDVVVELEIADAELFDQAVDRLVQVRDRGRVAQIQVIAVVLDEPGAAALQERLLGQLVGHRAAHPDHLGLQPQPGHHAPPANVGEDLFDAAREPDLRRLPRADAVPPGSTVVVPAGVDAEHLRAHVRGGVDQGEQFGGGRVAHQRVHVVVEHDRQGRPVRVGAHDGTAVRGERRSRAVQAVGGDGDGHRDSGEGRAGLQVVLPLVVDVGGAEQSDVGAVEPLTDLPPPGPVVLDLPQPRVAALPVDQATGRQLLAGRPGAGADGRDTAPSVLAVQREVQIDGRAVAERTPGPPALAHPFAVRPHHIEPRGGVSEETGGEGGDSQQQHRSGAAVGHPDPAPHRADPVGRPEQRLSLQPGHLVTQDDSQLVPDAVTGPFAAHESQPPADRGLGEPV